MPFAALPPGLAAGNIKRHWKINQAHTGAARPAPLCPAAHIIALIYALKPQKLKIIICNMYNPNIPNAERKSFNLKLRVSWELVSFGQMRRMWEELLSSGGGDALGPKQRTS